MTAPFIDGSGRYLTGQVRIDSWLITTNENLDTIGFPVVSDTGFELRDEIAHELDEAPTATR
jgi:hypothetical protein